MAAAYLFNRKVKELLEKSSDFCFMRCEIIAVLLLILHFLLHILLSYLQDDEFVAAVELHPIKGGLARRTDLVDPGDPVIVISPADPVPYGGGQATFFVG